MSRRHEAQSRSDYDSHHSNFEFFGQVRLETGEYGAYERQGPVSERYNSSDQYSDDEEEESEISFATGRYADPRMADKVFTQDGNANSYDAEDDADFDYSEPNYETDVYGIPIDEEKPAKSINGHYVIDLPVSRTLTNMYPKRDKYGADIPALREMSYLRYTAVTHGPSNFGNQKYKLRPQTFSSPRQTEIMIVITMYNEDDLLLARTLDGVFRNIENLERKKGNDIQGMWGTGSWKKIVVCIVSDGRAEINKRAQALLASIGLYQEGAAKSRVDNQKVKAHIYEYTTKVGIKTIDRRKPELKIRKTPAQLIFCLKEANAKKINSHRWAFQALAKALDPRIVVLLDVGTHPKPDAISHLWNEFHRDDRVGGCCGEIKVPLNGEQWLTNPLVYAQNFECKMSNILDKPTESVFGFISVLPGAFSAYRLEALLEEENKSGPLDRYYRGEFLYEQDKIAEKDDEKAYIASMTKDAGIFDYNMYLAEDRILCFEVVAKKNKNWLLRYCKAAHAETDVPDTVSEFILQRRRWMNGSLCAAIYAFVHFNQVWVSGHSFLRKFFLSIELAYQTLTLILAWFSISSYFIVFRILTTSLGDTSVNFSPGKVLSVIFLWLYMISILTTFVLSFGNRPKGTETFYLLIFVFFAVVMAYMIFASIFLAVTSVQLIYKTDGPITFLSFFRNAQFRDLVIATSSTYTLYLVSSILYSQPWHMFTSSIQYVLLSPSYVNVLNIYAFCNLHDVSWGTKGDPSAGKLDEVKTVGDTFVQSAPLEMESIDHRYNKQLKIISLAEANTEKKQEGTTDDYHALVRSMAVLVWMISNFVIIAVVLETGGINQFESPLGLAAAKDDRASAYLTVILWLVAFTALFRFLGCIVYLAQRVLKFLDTQIKYSQNRQRGLEDSKV